ncbi:MAG: hypothetical protein ACOYXY_09355 [Thermodesulfobacteriota bacterium]
MRTVSFTGLVLCFMTMQGFCSASSLDQHLHKNAKLDTPSATLFQDSKVKPISPREAALFALRGLEAKGVKDIVICEVNWIAGAISGYLVDAKGKATIDGTNYSTFRIGIRDSLEAKNGKAAAGEEFVFIARGEKEPGKTVWYPSPGPDYKLAPGEAMTKEMLAYEFLLHRDAFESLAARYP